MSRSVRFLVSVVVLAVTVAPAALVGSAAADEPVARASKGWCC